jgi:hypothetical protein
LLILKTRTLLTTSVLAGILWAGAATAEANPLLAIASADGLWPLAQAVSDAVSTVLLLGGAVAALISIRARFGAKRPS